MALMGMPAGMRTARAATTLVFFLTGAVFAAWSTRLPAIKESLGLTNGALALAILGLEAGAIAGLPAGGALVARAGSRAALRAGFVGFPLGLVAIAVGVGVAAHALALAAMAVANSVVDVAMNAQGVELERRFERPLLSGMHAGHGFGLAPGAPARPPAPRPGRSPPRPACRSACTSRSPRRSASPPGPSRLARSWSRSRAREGGT